jgi:hypothetical protein
MTDTAGPPEDGAAAARLRLETLFAAIDRLTPDELARIGYQAPPEDERDDRLDAIDEAARRTGRVGLVDAARDAAREAVMHRYAAGTFHPTFVGLNWGISQGPVADRVAIAEALADAAAAVVVEDALDPEIASSFAADAAAITGLALGDASDGSFARVLREPVDPELRAGPRGRRARRAAAAGMVALVAIVAGVGTIGAGVAALAAGAVAVARSMRRRPR